MPFFGQRKENEPGNKSGLTAGQVFGAIFNPCPGVFSPIGETVAVFARLLAYVFANFGLFPADHPVFKGGRENVPTVGQVFATASSRLVFNRRNIPQICLFFGIIAGLAAAIIAFFFSIFSVMVGTAHAAVPTQSYYSPVDANNDMALNWIDYLFKGKEMPNYLSGIGQHVPQSCLIQGAFIVALGFYSNAILIVAAIILFYHLASMIVETAHHGKVMGKDANEVWAPIRLVVAIGLLVPISTYRPESTCAGFGGAHSAGLNSGQYIVIKVAEWGSNLASQVWKRFVTYISEETYSGTGPVVPSMARQVVYNTMMRVACVEIYNTYFEGRGSNPDDKCYVAPAKQSIPSLTGKMRAFDRTYHDGSIGQVFDMEDRELANDGVCGGYSFIPVVESSNPILDDLTTEHIQKIRDTAYANLVRNATQVVKDHMDHFINVCVGGKDESAIPLNSDDPFTQTVNKYVGDMKRGLTDRAADFSKSMKKVAEVSGKQGWVSAGAWFNTVSRAQGALMETTGLLPATMGPRINLAGGDPLMSWYVAPAIQAFEDWLQATHEENQNTGSGSMSYEDQLELASAGLKRAHGKEQREDILDIILAQIDIIASWNGVWSPAFGKGVQPTGDQIRKYGDDNKQFTLGVQFGDNVNPLAEVTRLGHANIRTAYEIFDFYFHLISATGTVATAIRAAGGTAATGGSVLEKIPGLRHFAGVFQGQAQLANAFASLIEGARASIGRMIASLATIFLTAGMLLAYILPMIPFFSFLFGVVTWVISLLEAVICVPLIALAHLTPDGKGLPGPKALGAYHFLFNIFLRPVLMVFALMIALLIFYVAASFLNLFYLQAVIGAGGIAHGHVMFARLVYSVLYCAILYMVGKNCFKMITLLPTHAMKWGGLQSLTFHELGNADNLASYATLVQGKITGEMMQSIGSMKGPEALMLRSWMEHPKGTLKQSVNDMGDTMRFVNEMASPHASEANEAMRSFFAESGKMGRDYNSIIRNEEGGPGYSPTNVTNDMQKKQDNYGNRMWELAGTALEKAGNMSGITLKKPKGEEQNGQQQKPSLSADPNEVVSGRPGAPPSPSVTSDPPSPATPQVGSSDTRSPPPPPVPAAAPELVVDAVSDTKVEAPPPLPPPPPSSGAALDSNPENKASGNPK